MSAVDANVCPRCGLPIGRSDVEGPLWTPQIKGVEVCGCDEEKLTHERAQSILHDLDAMPHDLHATEKKER